MGLPKWAERALLDWPQSDRLEWQRSLVRAFTDNWRLVHAGRWKVPDAHPSYGTGHWDAELSSAELVRKRILQTALDVGWDRHYGRHPQDAKEAKAKLEGINDQICTLAEQLAKLFRDRDAILETQAIVEGWRFEAPDRDVFDLWDSVELAAKGQEFLEWHGVAGEALQRFLDLASGQSRPQPRWPDLLDQIGFDFGREVLIDDPGASAQSATNATEISSWGLQLIGTLDAGWHTTYPKGFLLECLTPAALAGLMRLTFRLPEHEAHDLNRAVSKLLDRYRNRAAPRP